ncbi:hypothetical protein EG328_009085 [Venturia inaequalis]|uniref:Uncharacterized protein n=1 Tax=Venturia inaequalis TaxID=5025 RepID=A0A8H3UCM4_VENIN|nr:hypothetical protein EG328_009085 [Venturia inaequalis]
MEMQTYKSGIQSACLGNPSLLRRRAEGDCLGETDEDCLRVRPTQASGVNQSSLMASHAADRLAVAVASSLALGISGSGVQEERLKRTHCSKDMAPARLMTDDAAEANLKGVEEDLKEAVEVYE